jgi:ABC-type uncharacterized transport system permease subunit
MMIAGYGWIAFILVIFGRWNTIYVYFGALFFSTLITVSSTLSILNIIPFIPPSYIFILPHISALIGLTVSMIWRKESGMPAALGLPYQK